MKMNWFVFGMLAFCGVGRAAEPVAVSRTLTQAQEVCALNLCYELAPGAIQVFPAGNGFAESLAKGVLNQDTRIGDLNVPKGSTVSISHPGAISLQFVVTLATETPIPRTSTSFAAGSNVRVFNYSYSTAKQQIVANSYLVYSGRLAQDSRVEGFPASRNADVSLHVDPASGKLVLNSLTLATALNLGKMPYLGIDLELSAGDRLDFYGGNLPSHVWFAKERVFTDNLPVTSASFRTGGIELDAVYAKSNLGNNANFHGLAIDNGPIWLEKGRVVVASLGYAKQVVQGVAVRGENFVLGGSIFFHDNGRVMRVKSTDVKTNRALLPPEQLLPTENGKPIVMRDVAYAFDDQGQLKAEMIVSGTYRRYSFDVSRNTAGNLEFQAAAVPAFGDPLHQAFDTDAIDFDRDKLFAARAALAAYVKK